MWQQLRQRSSYGHMHTREMLCSVLPRWPAASPDSPKAGAPRMTNTPPPAFQLGPLLFLLAPTSPHASSSLPPPPPLTISRYQRAEPHPCNCCTVYILPQLIYLKRKVSFCWLKEPLWDLKTRETLWSGFPRGVWAYNSKKGFEKNLSTRQQNYNPKHRTFWGREHGGFKEHGFQAEKGNGSFSLSHKRSAWLPHRFPKSKGTEEVGEGVLSTYGWVAESSFTQRSHLNVVRVSTRGH